MTRRDFCRCCLRPSGGLMFCQGCSAERGRILFTARSTVLQLFGEDGLIRFVSALRRRRIEAARRDRERRPA